MDGFRCFFFFFNHEMVFLYTHWLLAILPLVAPTNLVPQLPSSARFPTKDAGYHVTMTMRPGNLYKKTFIGTGVSSQRIWQVCWGISQEWRTYYRSFGVVVIPQQKCCILVSLILTPPQKNTTPFGRISVFSLATSTDTCVVRKDVGLDCSLWHPLQKTKYIRPQLSQMRIFT